jgi:2-succinyl-5-enolpyruvyl-6-hydroxy-3-cyclohexene-1-carboxylate synthase
MPHPKQHIRDLAVICHQKNIRHIVISPGSRSAPLIKAFYETFGTSCISIVDERSAAFFALGIAVFTQKPVVLICTSGTAVLNYAPAIAEAYYQQIPLIAITADRPHEWIDQQDNQTLRQHNIYKNFIKNSFELPQSITTDDDLWFSQRMVNDALNLSTHSPAGPVHINVPLTEPLYDELPEHTGKIQIIQQELPEIRLKLSETLITEWKQASRIIILHGQDIPESPASVALKLLAEDPRIIVIAENIANIQHQKILSNSNLVLSISRGKSPPNPDLILHCGGQIVSKALTGYLRSSGNPKCWRIGSDYMMIDTFRHATQIIPYPAYAVYNALSEYISHNRSDSYREAWLDTAQKANILAKNRLAGYPFSDIHVFRKTMEAIPQNALVALGNSSVIRYSQVFPVKEKIRYYSNRGTSGIDGSLSTAAGIAFSSKKLTIAIVGDLGFLYDSNALWNRELPSNLRILVINNQGGGIFHILKGPSEHPGFKKFIEAYHPVNIAKLAEAYGLQYLYADTESSFDEQWQHFTGKQKAAVIFEVKTDAVTSASAFRKLMVSS